MVLFWAAAALLTAGAAALMLVRAARASAAGAAADPSIEVHRRALAEIDELAERGLLPAGERQAARAEAGRRLLTAADATAPTALTAGNGLGPLIAAILVAVLTIAVYFKVGSPGLPDQPFAQRLAQWRAHPETAPPAGLAAALAQVARERPGDVEPLQRLAVLDLALGDTGGATHALRRAMVLAPAQADLTAMLGEVTVLRAEGQVTPDAQALFQRALADAPNQPAALYYLARARIAEGDVAGGLAGWRTLAARLPATDARRTSLERDIAAVERTGRLAPLAEQPAPAAPATDLQPAIRAMVDGLAARLAAHPDDPEGWVRLVRAFSVLGETARRDEALASARQRYAGRPDILGQLAAAAAATPADGSAN